ncbi:hypothetical protein HPB51_010399 [Rhipicephalus microplus]|uniref:Uncharacterized protein n=1 Tax=Rhipicephalus microplus TaxID=6941 RepID=A0A9J6DZT2_RHIMP|nr:hypothetical protein HPB51_010399 [Rhipicephalus microplus]
MTPCFSRCSLARKLCQPAVSAAPLGIDPKPVPALNQTFAASAERRCHSRMALVLLLNARPGALCVLDPTSPGTGALRNATGHHHPGHTMVHWKVKPASRRENVGAHGSHGSRALGHRLKGLSPLSPILFSSTLAWQLSGLPGEAQLRSYLKPRGLLRGKVARPTQA